MNKKYMLSMAVKQKDGSFKALTCPDSSVVIVKNRADASKTAEEIRKHLGIKKSLFYWSIGELN